MRDGIYFPPCECTREKGRINDMEEVLRSVFSETAVCVGNPELRGNQSKLNKNVYWMPEPVPSKATAISSSKQVTLMNVKL